MLNMYSQVGFYILIAIGCLQVERADAQLIGLGSCPNVNVVSNFNISQYTGKWYENRKYFVTFELGLRCVTATYTDNGSGGVTVQNVGKRIFGGTSTVTGTAKQLEPPNGKLGVTFPSVPFAPQNSPYWVLGTDYTSYAVVWSCTTRGPINTRIAWILTRDITPSDTTVNTALNILKQNNINTSPLRTTSQTNC